MVGGCLETGETERTRKMGTTWAATRVGLRGVKAGLGGHEAGVSGCDEGVEKASIPISKRGRMASSGHPTFSDFRRFENENNSERQNNSEEPSEQTLCINIIFEFLFRIETCRQNDRNRNGKKHNNNRFPHMRVVLFGRSTIRTRRN